MDIKNIFINIDFFFLRKFPEMFKHCIQEEVLFKDFPLYLEKNNNPNIDYYGILEKWYKYNNTTEDYWIGAIKTVEKYNAINRCNKYKNMTQIVLNNVEYFINYHTDLCCIIQHFAHLTNEKQIDNLITLYVSPRYRVNWMPEDKDAYRTLLKYCNKTQKDKLDMLIELTERNK